MQSVASKSGRGPIRQGPTIASYTALDVGNYLSTVGRRFLRWIIAAAVAVPFYLVATVIGLPSWVALVAAFVGAVVGSLLALRLTERLFGPEPGAAAPAPRGRGSGRRGASRP